MPSMTVVVVDVDVGVTWIPPETEFKGDVGEVGVEGVDDFPAVAVCCQPDGI